MSDLSPSQPLVSSPNLARAAWWVIILVGLFFLLRELAPILKPLFLAILLAYTILPFHFAVKKRVPARLSLTASILVSLVVLFLLTIGIQASVRTLTVELPELSRQASELRDDFRQFTETRFPMMRRTAAELVAGTDGFNVREITGWLVESATSTVTTAIIVGLYLLFILLAATRFPDRVRKAFPEQDADRILETIWGINRAISHYLHAKVKASLILAIPIFIVLFVFGTRFAAVWAILVFLCNFVPYIGSVVGYCIPTLFVLIQFNYGWEFLTIAIAMLAIHLLTASIVEPAVIGKAVGLSPLLVLLALAFWGFLWGLTGMLLAVPLTLMMKTIAEHIETTRPVARLLGED